MINRYLSVFLVAVLVGCAGFDDTNALIKEGKWVPIGERDGVRGLPSRPLSDLNQLAQQAGVDAVDIAGYERGYNEGIDRYCDIANAYNIGLSGMQYFGVCAYKLDGLRFKMEWQRGFDYFTSGDSTF